MTPEENTRKVHSCCAGIPIHIARNSRDLPATLLLQSRGPVRVFKHNGDYFLCSDQACYDALRLQSIER